MQMATRHVHLFAMLLLSCRILATQGRRDQVFGGNYDQDNDYVGQGNNIGIAQISFWQFARDILQSQVVNECGMNLVDWSDAACEYYRDTIAVAANGDENTAIEELFVKSVDPNHRSAEQVPTPLPQHEAQLHLHDACCVRRCTFLELMRHCVSAQAVAAFYAQRASAGAGAGASASARSA